MTARKNVPLTTPLEALAAWGQQPMALALRNVSAMLRAAEAINNLQLHATHTARAWHEHAEDQVETSKEGFDLSAMQSDFLQKEAIEVGSYWQNMFEVCVRLQSDLVNAWQPAFDHVQVKQPAR
jgi:Phasin protein